MADVGIFWQKEHLHSKKYCESFVRDFLVLFSVFCFLTLFFSLVKFSYWSKFNFNIITGSGVLTIFFYKGLTRNLEIGNTLVRVFPISGDWGVWDTKFATNVSNEMLLNAAKYLGYSFYRFWVIKGKPTWFIWFKLIGRILLSNNLSNVYN